MLTGDEKLTRARVLANIQYLTETNVKIRHVLDQTQLCPDMSNIIMDYFDGMYADEIMHIWNTIHDNSDYDNSKLSSAIIDFGRLMQTPAERQCEYAEMEIYITRLNRICGPLTPEELLDKEIKYPADDAGQEIFHDIIDALGLWMCYVPTLDDEIANYIISIHHVLKSTYSNRVRSNYAISFEAMNAIYILLHSVMWRNNTDNVCNIANKFHTMPLMPVWDYYSSRFVQYKKLNARISS